MNFLGNEVKINSVPLFIAELSCNHCGSLDNLLKLMDLAKRANADIIKIQVYTADEMTYKSRTNVIQKGLWKGKNLYELYQKAQTPPEWTKTIFDYGKSIDIPIFASVFGKKSLDTLENANCPAYKIASFEANDYGLIRAIKQTNKPIMISTGASSIYDIQLLIANLFYTEQKPILMHCVSKYPCTNTEASLSRIKQLQSIVGDSRVGYSDHTRGSTAAPLAAVLGAKFIEKHFHDPKLGKSEDAKFSLSPKSFKAMVQKTKLALDMCHVNNNLFGTTTDLKRSLYAVKAIKKGDDFDETNVKSLRPFRGLEPKMLGKVIGCRANTHIPAGTPLIGDYVQWK